MELQAHFFICEVKLSVPGKGLYKFLQDGVRETGTGNIHFLISISTINLKTKDALYLAIRLYEIMNEKNVVKID